MKVRKGYTLVELMIVILIVAILTAIAIPQFRGHIISAKWAEGKTFGGMIAVAIRTWMAGAGKIGSWDETTLTADKLGFRDSDLNGSYFSKSDFTWEVEYDGFNFDYTVTVTRPSSLPYPKQMVLGKDGHWTETE